MKFPEACLLLPVYSAGPGRSRGLGSGHGCAPQHLRQAAGCVALYTEINWFDSEICNKSYKTFTCDR